MRGRRRTNRGCIDSGDSTTAPSLTDTKSPNSPTDKVDDLGEWALNPLMLSTPFSYHGFSNEIDIYGKRVFLNITTNNLRENKEQGVSSELVWDSDPEMMSMAHYSTQSMN